MNIKDIKDKVECILKESIEARNCDRSLTWLVWTRFYFIGDTIDREKFFTLPLQSEITRIRALIQNDEKKYIPTVKEVAVRRGWKEYEWLEALNYRSETQKEIGQQVFSLKDK